MKQIDITLYRSELLYEIELTCFLTGEFERADDENDKPYIQDISSDGKVDKATLLMNRAWGNVVFALTAFSKEVSNCGCNCIDNEFVEAEQYDIALNVPDDFRINLLPVIKNSMHSYVVNWVCYEWFKIYKKEECEVYRITAEEELLKLKGYINKRHNRVRRTLRPF